MKEFILLSFVFVSGCSVVENICSDKNETIKNLQLLLAYEYNSHSELNDGLIDCQAYYKDAQEDVKRKQATIDRLMLELKDHRELYCPACDCDNCN